MQFNVYSLVVLIATLIYSHSSDCATWSENEFHFQYGKLNQPFAEASGTTLSTSIFTFQHASAWEYGSNFFFADYSSTSLGDELYAEWYPAFSSKALLNANYDGVLSDVSFVMGINMAPESDVLKYLPGIQLHLDVEGFQFLNVLITAYLDDSEGINAGGAPKEDDSWMVDIAWRYPLNLSSQQFYIEGHAEYIDERTSEIPDAIVESWVLAQIQARWDAGQTFFNVKDRLFLGIEYQYWNNKLGTKEEDSVVQALAVWRF
ncbi:hypothetical protein BK026_10500 [Alteromonas sp. V450]|uniref:hypothetical protein n=1 Tax=Alteromonas sp. V450 TaxID=1912139 RepID=UPI0008FF4A46|nr:hypothetical protein [Alteromonas sp. V450]OJF69190.1 hypothetical protein BK026_10500 [Alteromonas sp. V450]